jgi:CRISPR/Cas system CSM-associated protein Csm4 (group 5 of RAMP superfamily)
MTLSNDKISRFDPNAAYHFRKLDELNDLIDAINASKFRVSSGLQYYLQKYRQVLDIPRLCRALALPGKIAENFIEDKKVKQHTESLNDLGYLKTKLLTS